MTVSTQVSIKPLEDRIVIRQVEAEQTTASGLVIPDTAKEKPMEGEVIAVGNGKVLEDGSVRPLQVEPGNKILFAKYSGTEVTVDGEEHLILRESDVLGVIE